MEQELIKVAIFEDNSHYREGIVALIDATPQFSVVGAFPDCNKLIQRVEQCQPDIILMDISMPGLSGIEAVILLRKHFTGIQILMQTVFDEDDKIFASVCAGASGYILKNAGPVKLLEAIREVHEGGAAFTPAIAKKVLQMFQKQASFSIPEFIDLSEREKEILQRLVQGMSYKMIAAACHISYETVHSHIKKIYEKLHVRSMSEAVAKAIRNRIV
jgi:DNA-binding NarL/FixJ family response regulator